MATAQIVPTLAFNRTNLRVLVQDGQIFSAEAVQRLTIRDQTFDFAGV